MVPFFMYEAFYPDRPRPGTHEAHARKEPETQARAETMSTVDIARRVAFMYGRQYTRFSPWRRRAIVPPFSGVLHSYGSVEKEAGTWSFRATISFITTRPIPRIG